MTQDAEQSKDASADKKAEKPIVHTATLSEPKAANGKPAKPAPAKKTKKQRPEPTTPMGKLWHNWVKPIGSVVLIVVVFRSMLLDWNDVPTGSMEPEIHVGDRIAVNRLAYGLQFPLTGPRIGMPFTPVQFDNPLDGIRQINWGDGPDRGDIVTFWNPVSDVRMVKRIVAVPGDTIAMSGGELTINGQTASYTALDPVDEGLPLTANIQIRTSLGTIAMAPAPVTYQSESLLGLTRTVQHIEQKQIQDLTMLIDAAGTQRIVAGDAVSVTRNTVVRSRIDPTQAMTIPETVEIPIAEYLSQNPGARVKYRLAKGTPYLGGEAVSYNAFAAFLFERYESGPQAKLLEKMGLSVKGHELLVDGQPTFHEQFRQALANRSTRLSRDERQALEATFEAELGLLRNLLGTSFGPYTVPEDSYLMIGDNRNNSSDGRVFGPVKRSEITGQAFAVAFSFKDNQMLALPPKPAWSRFFKDLD